MANSEWRMGDSPVGFVKTANGEWAASPASVGFYHSLFTIRQSPVGRRMANGRPALAPSVFTIRYSQFAIRQSDFLLPSSHSIR
jgi:hypothetical protein